MDEAQERAEKAEEEIEAERQRLRREAMAVHSDMDDIPHPTLGIVFNYNDEDLFRRWS
ncbi:MAG TPA: hypothetical protein VNM40_00595 [Candidatus Paceibacterota bacterium]|nr:hypothetical protein [Candidatus Paceibacterota bacterium]